VSLRHYLAGVQAPMIEAPVSEAVGARTSLDRDARSFGLWITRLHWAMYPDDYAQEGVINYDYQDDGKGRAVRYRMIVDRDYRAFIHVIMPQIVHQGWHLTIETKHRRRYWQLVFEPILAPKVAKRGLFWHLTPRRNVAAILRQGLLPRASRYGFSYPQPRIYLIRDRNHATIMQASFERRDKGRVHYSLLQADLRRAKGVTVHVDPELAAVAVYTTEAIPPACLSLAGDIITASS
jgi:hypothetical protein